MRVGLFGGSFDPPHYGHVALARLARERLELDRILVAPVASQPLKPELAPTNFADRVAMARLAFANEPELEISLVDAPRPDGRSNYTLDTVRELRRSLGPQDALFCIMGADSFLTLGKWYCSAELVMACDFIVGARPGFDLSHAEGALPESVETMQLPTPLPHTQLLELSREGHHSRLYLLMDLAEDVSASQIRSALRGKSESGRVLDPAVEQYIRAHRLYTHL